MRKIYTGIDLGSDSVKIVVVELLDDKFHILAATSVKSVGIRRGLVTDSQMAINSVKLAVEEVEKSLGIKINKAIVSVPSNDRTLKVIEGQMKFNNKNHVVTGEDIIKILQESVVDQIQEDYEMVSIIPITFKLNDSETVSDPKGKKCESLEVKSVCTSAPKKNIYDMLNIFSACNIEIMDICFGGVADYYEAKGKDTANVIGAVVNIGSETIDVSVFNKGILIKNAIINLGSRNIDKDIAYIYGVDVLSAKEIKEKFAVCSRRYADINDVLEVPLNENEKVGINQYEVTEVVESRVIELLKLAKKQINDLTKRKISYIIVTGGISELTGFSYVVENILGINASTLNITTIGARNNQYSTVLGMIKYFNDKMTLRGKEISMVESEEIEEMIKSKKSMLDISDETIISRVFGYFSNN